MKKIITNYSEAIHIIKSAILKSRYRAAALANDFQDVNNEYFINRTVPTREIQVNLLFEIHLL